MHPSLKNRGTLFFLTDYGDAELIQSFCIGGGGAHSHQLARILNLRESDDIADIFQSEHERDKTVKTEGKTAVRGHAESESVEQETEFFLCFFGRKAEHGEHFGL